MLEVAPSGAVPSEVGEDSASASELADTGTEETAELSIKEFDDALTDETTLEGTELTGDLFETILEVLACVSDEVSVPIIEDTLDAESGTREI